MKLFALFVILGELALISYQRSTLGSVANYRVSFTSSEGGRVKSAVPRLHTQTQAEAFDDVVKDDGIEFLGGGRIVGRTQSEFVAVSDDLSRALKAIRVVRASAEMKHLMGLEARHALEVKWSVLTGRLDLDVPRAEALLQLLLDRDNVQSDVAEAIQVVRPGREVPLANQSEYVREAVSAETTKLNSTIEALLGTEKYASFKELEAVLPQLLYAQQIQQSLVSAGFPLSSFQLRNIQSVLMDSARVEESGKNFMVVLPADAKYSSLSKDGFQFAILPPGGVYVSPKGSIFSALTLSSSAFEKASQAMNARQAVVFEEVVARSNSGRLLAAGYQ